MPMSNAIAEDPTPAPASFLVTKEYRRFAEFCDACRRERYIGLCYGPPGVGKTLSARHYSNWDRIESYHSYLLDPPPCELREILGSAVVFYTPKVVNSPGQIERDIALLRDKLRELILEDQTQERDAVRKDTPGREERARDGLSGRTWPVDEVVESCMPNRPSVKDPTTLVIVDEADRLKMAGLEQLRDIFDRGGVGLVLIGMPGLEKRLARYPQLYSRVGFAHPYRPLGEEEMHFLLRHKWRELGLTLEPGDFTDAEAAAAVIRITGGNFRLVQRLFTQVGRILRLNGLSVITREVIEAAREALVIGTA
jgi:DNA transposition AAA+ family ATPase